MFPTAVTLRGIETYWNKHDKSIFDDIDLPEGINKSILVPFIITRGGDYPVINIDPDYLYNMTTLWFNAFKDNFARMILALTDDYDPLHNYDRTEIEEHKNDAEDKNTGTTSGTRNSSTSGTGSTTANSEDKVSPYNVNSYKEKNKNTTTTTDTTSTTGQTTDSGSSSDNNLHHDQGERKLRAFGNIGVTTSMTMLKEEVDGRQEYNIYTIIAEMYLREFTIPVF